MPIRMVHAYLVHPGKGEKNHPKIRGERLPKSGQLFDLVRKIYQRSDHECDTEIAFRSTSQQNDCRDLIVDYLRKPGLVVGRKIAARLTAFTDGRSGLGLLFLVAGKESGCDKLVVSRFAADNGVLAEEDTNALRIQFIERVFMRNAKAYKAAVYEDRSLSTGFWSGRAGDRQIRNRATSVSSYWIHEFLESDFRTTGPAGTKRLAVALRNASRGDATIQTKKEIAAATTLAPSRFRGGIVSVRDFCHVSGLSPATTAAVEREIHDSGLVIETFQFDSEEFARHLSFRSLELNNGALVMAPAQNFDDVFDREPVGDDPSRVRISTEGEVIDEGLRRRK